MSGSSEHLSHTRSSVSQVLDPCTGSDGLAQLYVHELQSSWQKFMLWRGAKRTFLLEGCWRYPISSQTMTAAAVFLIQVAVWSTGIYVRNLRESLSFLLALLCVRHSVPRVSPHDVTDVPLNSAKFRANILLFNGLVPLGQGRRQMHTFSSCSLSESESWRDSQLERAARQLFGSTLLLLARYPIVGLYTDTPYDSCCSCWTQLEPTANEL